ncbi:hypothetical protein D1872_249930 [compost metagenome]
MVRRKQGDEFLLKQHRSFNLRFLLRDGAHDRQIQVAFGHPIDQLPVRAVLQLKMHRRIPLPEA